MRAIVALAAILASASAHAEPLKLKSGPALEERGTLAPPRRLSLPRGVQVAARLLDFIDTAHEPRGQSFRAVATAAVVVEGDTVIPNGAALIVHLVPAGGASQTLDLVGTQLGRDQWAAFTASPAVAALATFEARDTRAPKPDQEPLQPRGDRVYLPAGALLNFTLQAKVLLALAPTATAPRR